MIEALYFYAFSLGLLLCAILTITLRNPVNAVLFMILGFMSAASLMIMIGAEFIGMMIMIVYVGAIAVLFLFIIMMLDIDITKLQPRNYPLKAKLLSVVVLFGMIAEFAVAINNTKVKEVSAKASGVILDNAHAIGKVLYTDYFYPFQIAGIILLAAMVGAVTLAMRNQTRARKQNVMKQINTDAKKILQVRKVEIGKGVE